MLHRILLARNNAKAQPIYALKHPQRGIAIPISLVFVLLLSFMGVSSIKDSLTNSRITSNHRDRAVALAAAEAALVNAGLQMPTSKLYGDTGVYTNSNGERQKIVFDSSCTGGYCIANKTTGAVPWEVPANWGNAIPYNGDYEGTGKKPEFLIEYLTSTSADASQNADSPFTPKFMRQLQDIVYPTIRPWARTKSLVEPVRATSEQAEWQYLAYNQAWGNAAFDYRAPFRIDGAWRKLSASNTFSINKDADGQVIYVDEPSTLDKVLPGSWWGLDAGGAGGINHLNYEKMENPPKYGVPLGYVATLSDDMPAVWCMKQDGFWGTPWGRYRNKFSPCNDDGVPLSAVSEVRDLLHRESTHRLFTDGKCWFCYTDVQNLMVTTKAELSSSMFASLVPIGRATSPVFAPPWDTGISRINPHTLTEPPPGADPGLMPHDQSILIDYGHDLDIWHQDGGHYRVAGCQSADYNTFIVTEIVDNGRADENAAWDGNPSVQKPDNNNDRAVECVLGADETVWHVNNLERYYANMLTCAETRAADGEDDFVCTACDLLEPEADGGRCLHQYNCFETWWNTQWQWDDVLDNENERPNEFCKAGNRIVTFIENEPADPTDRTEQLREETASVSEKNPMCSFSKDCAGSTELGIPGMTDVTFPASQLYTSYYRITSQGYGLRETASAQMQFLVWLSSLTINANDGLQDPLPSCAHGQEVSPGKTLDVSELLANDSLAPTEPWQLGGIKVYNSALRPIWWPSNISGSEITDENTYEDDVDRGSDPKEWGSFTEAERYFWVRDESLYYKYVRRYRHIQSIDETCTFLPKYLTRNIALEQAFDVNNRVEITCSPRTPTTRNQINDKTTWYYYDTPNGEPYSASNPANDTKKNDKYGAGTLYSGQPIIISNVDQLFSAIYRLMHASDDTNHKFGADGGAVINLMDVNGGSWTDDEGVTRPACSPILGQGMWADAAGTLRIGDSFVRRHPEEPESSFGFSGARTEIFQN